VDWQNWRLHLSWKSLKTRFSACTHSCALCVQHTCSVWFVVVVPFFDVFPCNNVRACRLLASLRLHICLVSSSPSCDPMSCSHLLPSIPIHAHPAPVILLHTRAYTARKEEGGPGHGPVGRAGGACWLLECRDSRGRAQPRASYHELPCAMVRRGMWE
jgi:hypothetical protein